MDPSYNNPLGGSQYPISSGSGDIVLTAPNKFSSKKKFIIIALVFLILVGVGVGLLFFFRPNPSNSVSGYRAKLNVYANNLLYGTQNKEKPQIDNLDLSSNFYIDQNYKDDDYIRLLRDEYNAFYEDLKEAEPDMANNIAVYSPYVVFDYLLDYDNFDFIDTDLLREKYDAGLEDAYAYIKQYYDIFDSLDEDEDNDVDTTDEENDDYEQEGGNVLVDNVKQYNAIYAKYLVDNWETPSDDVMMSNPRTYERDLLDEHFSMIKNQLTVIYSYIEGNTDEK